MNRPTLATLALAATLTSPAFADTAGWGSPDDAPWRYEIVCVETINLNTATASELQLLYRVGPALAERIIAGRPYETVEALEDVKGIGPATLEANWLWLAVEGDTTLAVKVPRRDPETRAPFSDWNRLPGCPDQGQGIDGCAPAQDPDLGTVAWECREP